MYKTVTLDDKSEILDYLESDHWYSAYAIGDLEPGLFEQCIWAGAEKGDRLAALTLLFNGLEPPALFLMGQVDGLQSILEKRHFPDRVYLACRPDHLSMTGAFYIWEKTIPMWRMVLQPERFEPVGGDTVVLEPSQSDQLAALYALGEGSAYSPIQLQQGVFYGIFDGGKLVATAGTHLVSPTYSVAAVGNVFTHPHYRGRGYGTQTTSAVVAELIHRGTRDIVLNVGQANTSAIRIYERLGFDRYCPFLEGTAIAKGPGRRQSVNTHSRP
jgi:ribosomal protein S18 acetylase RimI-like enzyme